MTDYESESEHLRVIGDRLFLARFPSQYHELDAPVFLGVVDSDPLWPSRLGEEPRWYLTELGMLVDAYEDSAGGGHEAEARQTYANTRGV